MVIEHVCWKAVTVAAAQGRQQTSRGLTEKSEAKWKAGQRGKYLGNLDLAYIDMGQTLDLTAVSNLSKLQRFLYS